MTESVLHLLLMSSVDIIVWFKRGGGGGGHANIFLTGMLVREQISTTQKNRMTLNSNPQRIECPKIQTQKNRMTQDAMFVKV